MVRPIIKSEADLVKWFVKNYRQLGFNRIQPSHSFDYLVWREGKPLRVEFETVSSNFFLHHHKPENVDLVICVLKNRKHYNLPNSKIIELSSSLELQANFSIVQNIHLELNLLTQVLKKEPNFSKAVKGALKLWLKT